MNLASLIVLKGFERAWASLAAVQKEDRAENGDAIEEMCEMSEHAEGNT